MADILVKSLTLEDSVNENLYTIDISNLAELDENGKIPADQLPSDDRKADKTNTVLNTYLSRGRKSGTAIGAGSFAFGNDVEASYDHSFAIGSYTRATGSSAMAEGYVTRASGQYSHAEGDGSIASGYASHAEGVGGTSASGYGAHAEGTGGSTASGSASHAEGLGTLASGQYSHAEGFGSKAGGNYSHAEGHGSEATNNAGHAENKAKAYGAYSHAEGESSANGDYSHAEGRGTTNNGYAHAEGYNTNATAAYSHAEGSGTTASGAYSHAEGGGTVAATAAAHAEGSGTQANALNAHAEGGGTKANGPGSHSEGNGGIAYGASTHAEGGGTKAIEQCAHAEGGGTIAFKENSHSEGHMTRAYGMASHAEGYYTSATSAFSHAGGAYNVEDSYADLPEWVSGNTYNVGDKVKVTTTTDTDPQITYCTGYVCTYANSYTTFSLSNWDYLREDHFVEIIGNGTSNARSNARALGWDGNEYLAGDVYVHCNADSTGGTKLAKITDVPDVSGKIDVSQKGAANGVAELDGNGMVPSSQLPSYVDDVLEYATSSLFPAVGETAKIYVDLSTNKTYRWGGSTYVEISPSLALGTTAETAFRGDYGQTAYQHASASGTAYESGLYKITTNSAGHVTNATAVEKADITALGIPGDISGKLDAPVTAGTNGQVLTSDGNGGQSWQTPSGGTVTDVQVNGTSVLSNGVANVPVASADSFGVVKVANQNNGLQINASDYLTIAPASSDKIKQASDNWKVLTPYRQHESVFYGLAKAAGDSTQSASANAVGTYTDGAKTAIKNMLGVVDPVVPVFTWDSQNEEYICDMTYAQVYQAVQDKKCMYALFANNLYILNTCSEYEVRFVCIDVSLTESHIEEFGIESDNTVYHDEVSASVTGSISQSIEYTSTSGHAYAVGDLFFWFDRANETSAKLVKAIVPIAVGDTLEIEENCTQAYLADEIAAVEDKIPDVQINGSSIVNNGVANIPVASGSVLGAVKVGNGLQINDGVVSVNQASASQIKAGTNTNNAIVPYFEDAAAFYGLAKAAGDSSQASSSNAVGTYTDTAKAAIRSMIGAENGADLIAVQDSQPSNPATQLWMTETPPSGVSVPTYAEFTGVIAPDYADLTFPVAKGQHCIKDGVYYVANQAISSSESWTAAHWTSTTVGAEAVDVQINGTSILSNGVANIPAGSTSDFGVFKLNQYGGLQIGSDGLLKTASASEANIKTATDTTKPIVPARQHTSVFYGLAKAAGSDMASSSNAVGTYTEDALSKIYEMLNAPVSVSGTTPSFTAKPGVKYVCGEVSTLAVTLPASGDVELMFNSGSTATVLTLTPPTGVTSVKFPSWFDPTDLEANVTYNMIITNGEFGVVTSWA